MSAVGYPSPEFDDDRFTWNGAVADGLTVAQIRYEFGCWLRAGALIHRARACDVILALNEALANTAEFAYPDGGDGTVDVEAVRDRARRILTVRVSDRGHCRQTDPLQRQRRRGRGIQLMRSLADSLIIDASGLGTSVCLRFEDVSAPSPVAAGAC
jgi:serine/threonine-protein kinase RsbW